MDLLTAIQLPRREYLFIIHKSPSFENFVKRLHTKGLIKVTKITSWVCVIRACQSLIIESQLWPIMLVIQLALMLFHYFIKNKQERLLINNSITLPPYLCYQCQGRRSYYKRKMLVVYSQVWNQGKIKISYANIVRTIYSLKKNKKQNENYHTEQKRH